MYVFLVHCDVLASQVSHSHSQRSLIKSGKVVTKDEQIKVTSYVAKNKEGREKEKRKIDDRQKKNPKNV